MRNTFAEHFVSRPRRSSAAELRSMACRMALNNASSSIGFVKNSTAPAFIAWTVIGTSPWPVMKMIGMSIRSAAMRFCRSRPLRSGSETSSTRQFGVRTRGRARNSSRRRECLRLPARKVDQQFQRFAHRDVVVHNENDWLVLRTAGDGAR